MDRHSAVPTNLQVICKYYLWFYFYFIYFYLCRFLGHCLLSLLRSLPGSEMEDNCLINGLLRENLIWYEI